MLRSPAQAPMDRFEVPLNRWKLLAQCLGALAFVALGVFLIRVPGRDGLWAQFMGAVTVAFFGAVGAAILFRLLKPGPSDHHRRRRHP